jgi:flagellar hook-length control protein FliK
MNIESINLMLTNLTQKGVLNYNTPKHPGNDFNDIIEDIQNSKNRQKLEDNKQNKENNDSNTINANVNILTFLRGLDNLKPTDNAELSAKSKVLRNALLNNKLNINELTSNFIDGINKDKNSDIVLNLDNFIELVEFYSSLANSIYSNLAGIANGVKENNINKVDFEKLLRDYDQSETNKRIAANTKSEIFNLLNTLGLTNGQITGIDNGQLLKNHSKLLDLLTSNENISNEPFINITKQKTLNDDQMEFILKLLESMGKISKDKIDNIQLASRITNTANNINISDEVIKSSFMVDLNKSNEIGKINLLNHSDKKDQKHNNANNSKISNLEKVDSEKDLKATKTTWVSTESEILQGKKNHMSTEHDAANKAENVDYKDIYKKDLNNLKLDNGSFYTSTTKSGLQRTKGIDIDNRVQTKLISKIIDYIEFIKEGNISKANLQITLDNLGKLKVLFKDTGDKVTAKIFIENDNAKHLVTAAFDTLKETFIQKGINLEQYDFYHMNGDSFNGNSQSNNSKNKDDRGDKENEKENNSMEVNTLYA